jgi:DNA repair protein RecO (recombination protein O)
LTAGSTYRDGGVRLREIRSFACTIYNCIMPLVADRSICLRRTEYSETSQVLRLFTRQHGLVGVIAKGAHRKTKAGASRFGGGIDLLDIGDAVFTHDPGRELATLTEWNLREGSTFLRNHLRGIYLGLYSAELVGRLIEEHDPHPKLFDLLAATLPELATPKAEQAFLGFELELLRQSGYLAELFACVRCQRAVDDRGPVAFSTSRGGVMCASCFQADPAADHARIDPRLLRIAQGILRLPRLDGQIRRLPQLTRRQTDPINRLLARHVELTLGRGMHLPRYVVG